MQKKTVYSFPSMINLVVELTKQGKVINKHWTRGSYGMSYVVAWEDAVDNVESDIVADEGVGKSLADDVVQETDEIEVPQTEDTEKEIEVDLTTLDIPALRELCDAKGIKYHPANRSEKLIELLQA